MEFNLIYNVAGEEILANMPDVASCTTEFAYVTLRREANGGSLRVTVASKGEALPEPHAQPNPHAARVARQFQETEDCVAVLERADILLRGSSTELRCSVVIDDSAPQAADDSGLLQETTATIVSAALNSLLGVTLPPAVRGLNGTSTASLT